MRNPFELLDIDANRTDSGGIAGPRWTGIHNERNHMTPILSPDLAEARPMLETYADAVADALLAMLPPRTDVRVCWSNQHDAYIVVVDTARWSSPRFVQATDWMVSR